MDKEEKWPKSANMVSTPKKNKHNRRMRKIIYDDVITVELDSNMLFKNAGIFLTNFIYV